MNHHPIAIIAQAPAIHCAALAAEEIIIERGIEHWRAVGMALNRIKQGKLFRPAYHSFPAYLSARWKISSQEGYRRIAASLLAQRIDPDAQLLHSERDARDLAQQITGDEHVTAAALDSLTAEQLAEIRAQAEAKLLDPLADAREDWLAKRDSTLRMAGRFRRAAGKLCPGREIGGLTLDECEALLASAEFTLEAA